ncbi:MAG: hypothetical protein CSB46_09580 [Micrococcales bacterium]|nr:MAG: hypothetical protein CSB46_09580 [Micrococcales bacterium]
MHIEHHEVFPVGPDRLAELFADEEFVRTTNERMRAQNVQIQIADEPSGAFTVSVQRGQSMEHVPEPLRRFAPHGIQLSQVERWEAPAKDGSRSGSVQVGLEGIPVSFDGKMTLRQAGANGSELGLFGDLVARIPLFGGAVERAARPAVTQQ